MPSPKLGDVRTRPAAGVAGALCVLISLTGCGVAPTSAASSAPVGTGSSSGPPASGSASASASVEPTGPVGVRYGTTYRWPDGLRVRVDEPVYYWPSGWVRTVNDFTHFRAIPVRVVNRTDKRVDLTGFEVTARSRGRAADRVQDPGKLGGLPPTKVAAGKSVEFKVGFGVKKTTGISVTIVRGPGFAEVRFTG